VAKDRANVLLAYLIDKEVLKPKGENILGGNSEGKSEVELQVRREVCAPRDKIIQKERDLN